MNDAWRAARCSFAAPTMLPVDLEETIVVTFGRIEQIGTVRLSDTTGAGRQLAYLKHASIASTYQDRRLFSPEAAPTARGPTFVVEEPSLARRVSMNAE